MQTIITNANLVLEHEQIHGTLVFDDKGITNISASLSSLPAAIDAEGDYLIPGLIETHTDNCDHHFHPRPKVFWPNGLAAMLSHDSDMVAAGITTVYNSVAVGQLATEPGPRDRMLPVFIDALTCGLKEQAFRADHRLHFRCELAAENLLDVFELYAQHPALELISMMDHTPGQRQWRDIDHLRRMFSKSSLSAEEREAEIKGRIERGSQHTAKNKSRLLAMIEPRNLVLASHDDTTIAHVQEAKKDGLHISEFPTTYEAAQAAKSAGLFTIGGAPNLVRGSSHSGNVSIADLVQANLIDALSSDYAPSSLLQAVFICHFNLGLPLPQAVAMVTWRTADMMKLTDRGRLAPNQQADLVRIKLLNQTPLVKTVWRKGQRVF